MDSVMLAYDANFSPPAPAVTVELGSLVHPRRRRTATAILDTGADITAIPADFAKPLNLYPIGRLQLEGVSGKLVPSLIYAVRLQVAGLGVPHLEVVLTPFEFVVLGRDVLNRFYMRLDGPDLLFSLGVNR